jgi:Ca2+-binding EF-hand superfamily protein
MSQTDPGASSATAPAAAPSDPKAIIASEYPTYDKDSSGGLSKGEFDTWMTALKDKSGGTPMSEKDKTSWLKTAFTTADKDKDKAVSLTELTDYLTAQG